VREQVRVEIRVQPGARSTSVGGTHGEALVVRVTEAPEKGRASTAALRALAQALGVRASAVRLVSGATSRRKVVEIDVAGDTGARGEDAVATRLDALRRATGPGAGGLREKARGR
jgi:uncharacterized protein (TIGR00251 family)